MANTTEKEAPARLNIDGRESEVVTLPAHSFNTFTLAPAKP